MVTGTQTHTHYLLCIQLHCLVTLYYVCHRLLPLIASPVHHIQHTHVYPGLVLTCAMSNITTVDSAHWRDVSTQRSYQLLIRACKRLAKMSRSKCPVSEFYKQLLLISRPLASKLKCVWKVLTLHWWQILYSLCASRLFAIGVSSTQVRVAYEGHGLVRTLV